MLECAMTMLMRMMEQNVKGWPQQQQQQHLLCITRMENHMRAKPSALEKRIELTISEPPLVRSNGICNFNTLVCIRVWESACLKCERGVWHAKEENEKKNIIKYALFDIEKNWL